MAQQFGKSVDETLDRNSTLRAQRMTADESRAVIDLWQSEQTELTGLTDKPAVPDVAEGLDITVEDVQRLLSEVRARRIEEERVLSLEQELAKIRLAEEERRFAEIQRQRAELRREQAEAARHHSAGRQVEAKLRSPLRTPQWKPHHHYEQERGERHSIRNQKALDESGYLSSYVYAGIIIVFTVFVVLSNVLK